MKKNLTLSRVYLGAAFVAIGALAHSASADHNSSNQPVVEDRGSTKDANESKDSEVILQPQTEKWWWITMESGYETQYVFRGTNLTTNSDGLKFDQVYVSGKGFTFGVWIGVQLGTAEAGPGVTALGESGGSTGATTGDHFFGNDFAVQDKFREIDIFSSYRFSFGPIDVTLGNIVFLIRRHQVDEFRLDPEFVIPGSLPKTFEAPGNETFDRIFLAISTSKFRSGGYSLIPTVTYYQTVYNHGSGPPDDYTLENLGFIRNNELGGYLEGKIQGVIPIIENVLTMEPFALIAYSFNDRSEAVNLPPELLFHEPSSRPLTGFHHVQVGVELVVQISKHFSITGFADFSHHISDPTGGTERDEWWAGGKGTVSF